MPDNQFFFIMKNLIYGLLFTGLLLLMLSSCKKDVIPHSTLKFPITFSATMHGDVVPWLKNNKNKGKGNAEFTHKYFNHIIRINTTTDTWVADIPITNGDDETITYSPPTLDLPVGTYNVYVMPTNDILTGVRQASLTEPFYSVPTIGAPYEILDKAPFYTPGPVVFNVVGASTCQLNVTTDYACVLFDMGGTSTWVPQIAKTNSMNSLLTFDEIIELPPVAIKTLFYDGTPTVNVFYGYTIPGASLWASRQLGYGNVSFIAAYATFIGIDFSAGAASPSKTVAWLKDYSSALPPSLIWKPNTTIRVTFITSSQFDVNYEAWFPAINDMNMK
jgi:hypothetical protein